MFKEHRKDCDFTPSICEKGCGCKLLKFQVEAHSCESQDDDIVETHCKYHQFLQTTCNRCFMEIEEDFAEVRPCLHDTIQLKFRRLYQLQLR